MSRNLIFRSTPPQRRAAPLVVNSPHSGRAYPPDFLAASRLKLIALRRLEDFCVDALVADAPACGAFLLHACFPRLWLDVNRAPYELDRALFTGPLPAFADTASARAQGGRGTFARLAGAAGEIYRRKPGWEEVQPRLATAYFPYHAELARLLEQAGQQGGQVLLLDFHSMPSGAAPGRDIVLGDLHGRALAPSLRDAALAWFKQAGLRAGLNDPYAGGHITAHYGKPAENRHALQIEISRGLYMDEAACRCRQPDFAQLRGKIGAFLAHMAQWMQKR